MRWRITVAALVAVWGACAATARAQAPIATEPFVSKLAAYGGVLAWSHFDAGAGVFRLTARVHGRVSLLPVAAQPAPFDVSLGPDRRGRTVAVYSRCAADPQPPWSSGPFGASAPLPQRCAIYRYDFATRRERRLPGLPPGGSNYLPAIWHDTLAYVRVAAGHGPRIYEQPIDARGHRRLVARGLAGGDRSLTGPGPTAIALRGSLLAASWQGGEPAGGWSSEILLDPLPGSPAGTPQQAVLDAETADSRSPAALGWPSLTARGVLYGRFDGSPISPPDDALLAIGLSGAGASATAAPHAVRSVAFARGAAYVLYGAFAGSFGECPPPGCALIAVRDAAAR